MSMGSGHRGGRMSSADTTAQRQSNEQAPQIKDLGRRVMALFAPYRWQLWVIIALVVLAAALGIVPAVLTAQVFDDGLFPPGGTPNLPVVFTLVGVMLAAFFASAAISIVQTKLTATVGNRVMGDLRVRLFGHLQRMELAFFTRTKTGVIQSRLQNDVGGVANVLTNTVSSVIGNTVTVLAAVVAMLALSWQLTIVAGILLPVLVIAQRRVGRVRAKIAGKTQESLSDMSAITQETLSVSGVLLSKTFTRAHAETDRYAAESQKLVGLQTSLAMSGQWFFAGVQVFLSAVPALVYLVSAWLITGGSTEITAGTIVAFTTVQARLLFPLMGLMRVVLDLQTSSALFARIFEYLDLQPQITDRVGAHSARAASEVGVSDPSKVPLTPDTTHTAATVPLVQCDAVSFRYPDATIDAPHTLDSVSFSVQPGEFVAFVGPSGSGKTTISYLIPRLYDATAGSVRFAGDDVRELTQTSIMDQIGMVTQEAYLFHATIAENLRYGNPEASLAQLEAAARAANIHETIVSFADGYDTVVGERGYRLSGGEKQRIAIARVLLKNPQLLILDEATSALDTVSERIVQRALDAARAGRTTIAIAHRLSTVIDADRIFVLDRGRIVESGSHTELLALRGLYWRLHREQSGDHFSEDHVDSTD